ncbi:ComF family protein [candidate division KSB3 bacterium]|uniref:ComF family protein n=1 Tax=candidate division KSB3 bacterium TaxID=2044937 RepID=A0A9D5JV52_9BACT|nr:ComF family protein [candidate division KSB3 bacterium]MBD3324694.1 ComF family protein [candidate division KSB3 bacterium]
MTSSLSVWLQTALDFVFPAECGYCQHFVGDDRVLIFCKTCWSRIVLISEPVCPQCGKPFDSSVVRQHAPHRCGACRTSPPFFDFAFAPAHYDGVLKEAILQFKFHQKPGLGRPLAHLLLGQIPPDLALQDYEVILPVPLHKSRQKQRGYNQAAILARHLARPYHLELMPHNLIRTRDTHAQSLLQGSQERQTNVKNAFHLRSPEAIRDRRVILVDDVLTTGATVNECAKTLKNAGARTVCVLTVSRV